MGRFTLKSASFALTAVAAWTVTLATAFGGTDRGYELAVKVDKANSGFLSEVSQIELELLDASGSRVSRQLEVSSVEGKGDGDRSVVRFTAPADVKGTKLLTWAHAQSDDDQWLFLPAIKRVKRISGSNKSGSFMGSEFSYEDLVAPEVEKFNYRFIEETSYEGTPCWVYERASRDSASGYKRQVLWVSQKLMYPVKVEFYNRRDELSKVALYGAFKKYGSYYRPGVVQMSNVQTRKKSVLRIRELKLGAPVSDTELRPDTLGG
jgi:hypothetical protein